MESHSADSDASLRILGDELRSLGMVVVPRDDGLEVRLSTFETVRIRLADSVLQCESRFGAVSRTRARWTFSILSAVLVPELFLTTGVTASTMSVAFLLVLAAVSQGVRYTVTESIVSRIQMVWLNLRRGSSTSTPRDPPSLRASPFTPDAPLREGAYVDDVRTRSELPHVGDKDKR
jgi:hypothetical protein